MKINYPIQQPTNNQQQSIDKLLPTSKYFVTFFAFTYIFEIIYIFYYIIHMKYYTIIYFCMRYRKELIKINS